MVTAVRLSINALILDATGVQCGFFPIWQSRHDQYVALVPIELRESLHGYLSARLGVETSARGPLMLSAEQLERVVALAHDVSNALPVVA